MLLERHGPVKLLQFGGTTALLKQRICSVDPIKHISAYWIDGHPSMGCDFRQRSTISRRTPAFPELTETKL